MHTQPPASTTVYDILQHTSYTASELWKEARLGHLSVVLTWSDDSESASILTCLDNVRAQWTTLRVLCGTSKDTLFVIQREQEPHLTLYDICTRVEQSSEVWLPTHTNAEEWSFLLQSSNSQDILNTTAHVHSKWWSAERFGCSVHRFTAIVHIEVFPCLMGLDVQNEMGLCGNRSLSLQHTQPPPLAAQPPNTPQAKAANRYNHLRKEQDDAYYASLKADQAKKCKPDQDTPPIGTQLGDNDSSGIGDEVVPLSTEQLREARCRFFRSSSS